MEVILIWVRERDVIWLYNAWDEYSRDENSEGFDECVARAHKNHGDGDVRLQRVIVPGESIEQLFEIPTTPVAVIPMPPQPPPNETLREAPPPPPEKTRKQQLLEEGLNDL